MRTRAAAIAGVVCGVVCLAAVAHAEPRAEIAAKTRAAMASYDAMDYDAARRLLNQALAIAKRAKLDRDPIVARVYLDLGIAQLASSDQEAAKVALLSAVQIDPKIAIDPAYKSTELVRMLEEARAAAGDTAEPASDDCRTKGIQVVPFDGARRGVAQTVEVLIGGDVSPARVVAMYRPEGAIDFTEAKLTRKSGCRYAGTIPAAAMHGALVHYYIAAYDANNRVLASKGSSGSPGVLELGGAGAPAHAADDPVEAGPPPASDRGGDVVDRATPPARGSAAPTIVIAVSGGTGLGYVTGKTEGQNMVQKCCLGASPVVISPEISYRMTPRLSLGAVARLGFPIGANIMGHSSIAPAGFVRLGYALSDSGDGVHVMGELGFGILRNTIKLDTNTPGMDTDIVAQGPLLVGAGIGYTRRLGKTLAVGIDLDTLAGLAILNKLGTAVNLNSGISADLRVGFAVGF